MRIAVRILIAVCCLAFPLAPAVCGSEAVNIGHFPNITHAQALVARNLGREGRCPFEKALGKKVAWHVYNAGPTAMEAILTGALDFSYVGPSPALNLFIRSGGCEVAVLAGSASGGSALLIQPDITIANPGDFKNRIIATPQFGNTQDIACRHWLLRNNVGIAPSVPDGARVMPTANPDQLTLFLRKDIDAVWTVEPWVSRLIMDAGAKIFLEEPRDSVVTLLSGGRRYIEANRETARIVLAVHNQLTAWIRDHPEEARARIDSELSLLMGRTWPKELTIQAWKRLVFDSGIRAGQLEAFMDAAYDIGFIKERPDISGILVNVDP